MKIGLILLALLLCNVSSQKIHSNSLKSQMELAFKATEGGSTFLAACAECGTVAISIQSRDAFVINAHEHVSSVSPSLLVGTAGLASDVAHLLQYLFSMYESRTFAFDCEPTKRRLASSLADYMHRKTVTSLARPFAAKFVILGGTDERNVAYTIDPSGALMTSKFAVVGRLSEKLKKSSKFNTIEKNSSSYSSVSALTKDLVEGVLNIAAEEEDNSSLQSNSLEEMNATNDLSVFVQENSSIHFKQLPARLIDDAAQSDDWSQLQHFLERSSPRE